MTDYGCRDNGAVIAAWQ